MSQLDSIARTVIQTSLDPKPGDNVLIHGWDHTIDLMSKLAWQSRKRGCRVLLSVQPEDFWLRSIMNSPLSELKKPNDLLMAALRESQHHIFTLGPRSPIQWEKIPPNRRKEVSVWLDTRYDRSSYAREWARVARKHHVRMLGLQATLATPERATRLNLDYRKWWKVMISGCGANWKAVSKRASRLGPLLGGQERVHLTTPAGTQLEFKLDKRHVSHSNGLTSEEKAREGMVTFLPSGGTEVSIDKESAQGRLVYDLPILSGGNVVRNLDLRLKDGRVTEFRADEGKRVFAEYLRSNPDAGRLSFFGLGLNPSLSFGFTQDDKVLGGVTLGFGDNERKGGDNKAKGKEWWGAVSHGSLAVGNTKVLRQGIFLDRV